MLHFTTHSFATLFAIGTHFHMILLTPRCRKFKSNLSIHFRNMNSFKIVFFNHLYHTLYNIIYCNAHFTRKSNVGSMHACISIMLFVYPCSILLHPNYTLSYTLSNECWEKPQKCTCMSNVLGFFFQAYKRASWSLTPQLDTVIIQVFSVRELSLIGNPLGLYRAKRLPLMKLDPQ